MPKATAKEGLSESDAKGPILAPPHVTISSHEKQSEDDTDEPMTGALYTTRAGSSREKSASSSSSNTSRQRSRLSDDSTYSSTGGGGGGGYSVLLVNAAAMIPTGSGYMYSTHTGDLSSRKPPMREKEKKGSRR